jgi:hypothetical protein
MMYLGGVISGERASWLSPSYRTSRYRSADHLSLLPCQYGRRRYPARLAEPCRRSTKGMGRSASLLRALCHRNTSVQVFSCVFEFNQPQHRRAEADLECVRNSVCSFELGRYSSNAVGIAASGFSTACSGTNSAARMARTIVRCRRRTAARYENRTANADRRVMNPRSAPAISDTNP